MEKKCLFCGTNFTYQRITARYCSKSCISKSRYALPVVPKARKCKIIINIGDTFDRLTVTDVIGGICICSCICGNTKSTTRVFLKHKRVRSCGCLRSDSSRKKIKKIKPISHSMTNSPTHTTWKSMRKRVKRRYNSSHSEYLGKEINICANWESFENFLADMGVRPDGKKLKRIDISKGFTKDNCIWD